MEERLQKILAKAGIASRRQAEQLIRAGRIQINDQVVVEMGCRADPGRDRITCDGKPIVFEEKIYVLLNKPAGYVTTLADPQGRPMVSDLLTGITERLFPVGRLDLDTEGALLMTNDGNLANRILHPRFEVNKTYEALVSGFPAKEKLALLAQGIMVDGIKTQPARVRVLQRHAGASLIEITIHEGKKRQVRKMFQAIGHRVLHLKRTAYGRLSLGSLALGKFRVLSADELKKIFSTKSPLQSKT
ncbi:MAG: rRNA pseudouridine synthase [Proteobacteria bacterium]|nr:rRNA pseudouridine synthase [Pseudomonadota bacterium]